MNILRKLNITASPWESKPEEVDKAYIRVRGTVPRSRHKICNVITPFYEGVNEREAIETRANAKLIAASPEMLESFFFIIAEIEKVEIENINDFLDQLHCICCTNIEKATGKSWNEINKLM